MAPNISIVTLDLFDNTPGGLNGLMGMNSALGDDIPGECLPNLRPVVRFGCSRGVGNQNEYQAKLMLLDSDDIENSEMDFDEGQQ